MKQIVLFCALVCLYIHAGSQTIMGRQMVDQFPVSSTGTLVYGLTWLPLSYANTTRSYPLIIFLHGAGETGTTAGELSKLYNASPRSISGRIGDGWNAVAVNPRTGQRDSFIVVSPQASSWSHSYTQLKYMLPDILNRYRVDRSRIYLTGLSAGGGGTNSTMGSRDSLFIKNFAAMVTASSAGVNASNGYTALQVEEGLRYGSRYGVRMWTIAGDADYLLTTDVRYHDSTNAFTNFTPRNKLTVISGVGHSAWGRAYDTAFRPVVNFYGNTGNCNSGCAYGGIPVAPNNNGSTMRGSGVTQDSLNIYEWMLLYQRADTVFSPNFGDYRSNAPKPTGGRWNTAASWQRFNGSAWVTASTVPALSTGFISIKANDSLDIDVAVTIDQLKIEQGGSLSVQTASLTLSNGPGVDLINNGNLYHSNSQTIGGTGTALVNGTYHFSGGTLSVATTTGNAATINFITGNNKNINAAFTNNGTINWYSTPSGGNVLLTNAVFTNNGLINEEFLSNRGLAIASGTTAFFNNGTLKKKSAFAFLNNGVPFTNNGTLQGVGSYNFTPGTITNNGTIKPGNSPGILTVTGAALTGQNTTVRIDIFDGSGAGTGHNRLDLTGNISLSGNDLVVTELTNAPAQPYTVLTTTGIFTGSFDNISLPAGYALFQTPSEVILTKSSGTLPALWGDFSATGKTESTLLKWTTLQEDNTSYFAIEYSSNGRDYSEVGTVPAAGSAAFVTAYQFEHRSSNSDNYYRIKLYDKDGKVSYSSVRSVKFRNQKVVVVNAAPNPMMSYLQIQVQERLTVKLVDMNGIIFISKELRPGAHVYDVNKLPVGMYQLVIFKENVLIETQKLVKQ